MSRYHYKRKEMKVKKIKGELRKFLPKHNIPTNIRIENLSFRYSHPDSRDV